MTIWGYSWEPWLDRTVEDMKRVLTITVTRGTVSGFASEGSIRRAWIRSDALIGPGNSGGLATDENGRMIGIPSASQAMPLGQDDKVRIGLIRPVNLARHLLANIPPLPGPSPTPTATPTPTPCLPNASFVADITVPDDSVLEPGTSFTKVWRMRSTGCAPWPPGTRWVFVSGSRMEAPYSVKVPSVAPDKTVDIMVPMRAPSTPGKYQGNWQLQAADGQRFGDQAFVRIVVATPTPTPTPTPKPDTRPQVNVIVENDTGGSITLELSGPAKYTFHLPPGTQTIRVVKGEYRFKVTGCGGVVKRGTTFLESGGVWRFWCGSGLF